jgi:hypothetical protein
VLVAGPVFNLELIFMNFDTRNLHKMMSGEINFCLFRS